MLAILSYIKVGFPLISFRQEVVSNNETIMLAILSSKLGFQKFNFSKLWSVKQKNKKIAEHVLKVQ